MRIILLALSALAASESLAEACTCISSGPPCQAAWQVDAVFAARVITIADAPMDSKEEIRWPQRRVHVRVTEAFRGIALQEIHVFTGSGGGDCGYNFTAGGDYLIYAYRDAKSGRMSASICSRTRSLADAADDLRYLRGAARKTAPGLGQLVGTVRRLDRAPDGMSVTWVPDSGISVTATGDRTYRARTATDGSFEMAVLAGKYQVTVDLPDELYVHGPEPAEVRDLRGCAEVTLVPQWNGRVAGRVLNAAGEPVPGFAVELLPRGIVRGRALLAAVPSSDGRRRPVRDSRVPPAAYYLGSDLWRTGPRGRDRSRGPEGLQVFLTDEASARRVMGIGRGNRIQAADFVPPERVSLAEVGGVVVGPDGTPATGAKVYVQLDTDESVGLPPPAVTAMDGRFSVTIIAGRQYRVTAEGYESGRYASRAERRGIGAPENVKGLRLELKPLKSGGS